MRQENKQSSIEWRLQLHSTIITPVLTLRSPKENNLKQFLIHYTQICDLKTEAKHWERNLKQYYEILRKSETLSTNHN